MAGPARHQTSPLLLAGSLLCTAPLTAQGAITGTISDSATGFPLEFVTLRAVDAGGRTRAATLTDARGRYRLAPLAAGAWTVTVARIGYAEIERIGIRVADGAEAIHDVALSPRPVPAAEVIVTASRQPEIALTAPAATSVVQRDEIDQEVSVTPIDYLAGEPGMDVASKGLGQRTYTARGSRSASSGSFLTLTDGRDMNLPSIGFNIPYLMPGGSADVDRIEIMRGPAGAAYGPNTERGVAQVFTRSPFDAPGTTLSFAAGGRDVLQGELRQAGMVGTNFGYKLTGTYFSGTDWVYPDTIAMAKRDTILADSTQVVDPDTLLVGVREPDFVRYSLGGLAAWRASDGGTVQAGATYAHASSAVDLEPTLGSIQLVNWGFGNVFGEYTRKAVTARVSYTWNGAGDSYSLWYGNPLVDNSAMLVAQAKAGAALAQRGTLQYGADFRYTNPKTDSTINGRNEEDDQVAEVGAFLMADLPLGTRFELSAALRADYHDVIGTVALAPRLALVYQPTPMQAFRLTYGRGYTTPSPTDFFADIQVADDLEGLPFQVQISGIPPGGYQFARNCGGLCMRSPFDPDRSALQPIDATAYWDAAVEILYQQTDGAVDLRGIPAPTSAEVGSTLKRLDPAAGGFDPAPVDPATIQDYPTEGRETTDAIELGYKAALGSKWSVAADVAYSYTQNFFTASYIGTPNVFLDEAQLAAYLTPMFGGDAAMAAQVAAGMSGIPLGVVNPVNAADPSALLMLRRQGGSFSRVGVDLEVGYLLADGLTVTGNYSWVNRDSIGRAGGSDMAVLSAPRNKGALAVRYRPREGWWGLWAQGLAVEGYPVKSGWYKGNIPSYAVVNLGAQVALPSDRGITLAVTATNLFDNVHQEYVGAPGIGRLVMVRLQAEF
ncbi:MAG TPA: TonB-dependent receptor [Gemmatimonadales bacterium]|nr:TonB-dependent receptor [Gemmatimonadales bacterium]